MREKITKLETAGRWHVPFEDTDNWRVGVYYPEYSSPSEIKELEKHSCPELFICMKAPMGLLVYDGSKEHCLEMNPGEALMVTDYHNGYVIDPEGFFFVVEGTDFFTEYISRPETT